MSYFGYMAPIYVIVGVAATAAAVRFSQPGTARVLVFATVFSLFFSLGLAVGHGVMPYPGLLLLLLCGFDACGRMYGSPTEVLLFVLSPMLVQWLIVLAVSFGIYRLAKRRQDRRLQNGRAPAAHAIHEPIIGSIWLIFGILLLLVLSYFALFSTAGEKTHIGVLLQMGAFFLLGLLQVATGLALLMEVSWSRWLCIPLSLLALPVFPVGTALAAYYFWYYMTYVRNPEQL